MRVVRCVVSLMGLWAFTAHADPLMGGFWQSDSSTTAYPPLSATQIAAFLPDTRSTFTFPSPYNTQGVRVTLPSDCPNSSNCVQYIGYDYWARMNNSAGSPFMYILVGLGKGSGVPGPTIYKYDKDKGTVTLFAHLFAGNRQHAGDSAQTMYFSHDHPYGLYYYDPTALKRIDILSRKVTTIFNLDSYSGYQSGDILYMCSSSYDDKTHACILEDSSYAPLGCLIYHSDTSRFRLVPNSVLQAGTEVHQCHVGAGGKYLIMTGNETPYNNTAVWNIASNTATYIASSNGGGGHFFPGFGHYLQLDNQGGVGSTVRLWNVSDLSSGGDVVWEQPWSGTCPASGSCSTIPQHPSWLNTVPASQVPVARQYACDGTSNNEPVQAPFGNQVYCFYLDASVAPADMQSLVVAPTMINQSKGGCPGGPYGQYPKGNIDFTGHYYIWSANLDSDDNCQVFIARIPVGNLPHPPGDQTPPEVSITAPATAATVSRPVVSLTANAQDNYSVSQVAWMVDSETVATETSPPYTYDLDTATLAPGSHVVAAVATDDAGNTAESSVQFAVAEHGGSGGSVDALSLAVLGLLGLASAAGTWRSRRRRRVD